VRIWPYAGNSGYPALPRDVRADVYHGDNVSGDADNQQERLIEFRGWVIGFVDGEGCFSIGFVRQSSRASRKGYAAGYQVFHRFVVTQGARSRHCLEELGQFFGVGRLYVNERHDNHRESLCQYIVGRRSDLLERIIPFFQAHPLRTSKQQDFERFVRCMAIVDSGRHRTREGLVEIAEITETMNHRKPRQELIRILRDHTPDVRDSG
jgi:LAGLIDADG DNA endonuclease family protein